ncbi:LOG family protein [bacterium BMS3Abin03]|nr:LOG family protein [bacterium BMS3Abin03]
MDKIITIFGSGESNLKSSFYTETEELGKTLAENGFVICCGGYGGTMEAVCKGAKSAGGKTIGITIDYPGSKPNKYVDENVVMPNWVERLMELIAIGDAYVVLKGGSGTLVEISSVIEMMNKKIMKEKLMVFYGGFWKDVIKTLKNDPQHLHKIIKSNIIFASNLKEILNSLKSL